jgi:hypothetical protein
MLQGMMRWLSQRILFHSALRPPASARPFSAHPSYRQGATLLFHAAMAE